MTSKLLIAGLTILMFAAAASAQTAPVTISGGPRITMTGTSANVSDAGSPVNVSLFRWSTPEEQAALVTALTPPAPGAAPARGAAAGRGGAAGGGGGRGGGNAAPAAPPDPIVTLTAAIVKATTIGYIWTSESVGYPIRYAYHAPTPDGGERIIFATDRKLGVASPTKWKPVPPPTSPDYEFTIIEMKLDSKGLGEGKVSLTTKVVVDAAAKTVALENYAGAPVLLKNVKR